MSDVYFADFTTKPNGESVLGKLGRMIEQAGISKIDFQNKFVAIKIHFGEEGNLSYLRHNYAKVLVDIIKAKGGKPFLTDCNTLYVGSRKNALDHLDCAYLHGYFPFATGCHVIIGDGLKGTDETIVPIDGEYVKNAKIGSAIRDADIIISLTHFKGHEMTGFGGAVKNIGMGCGSRAGKMEMHNEGKPTVYQEDCKGCLSCLKVCAHGAITIKQDKKATIDQDKCVGCGRCIGSCLFDAIENSSGTSVKILNYKMAEYTYATLKDREHFHISLVRDVSPNCDCHAENDVPIIPDVGMFASFDPIALDKACVDMANKQPVMQNSMIAKNCGHHDDRFTHKVTPNAEWETCLEHAQKLGIGTLEYNLIEVK